MSIFVLLLKGWVSLTLRIVSKEDIPGTLRSWQQANRLQFAGGTVDNKHMSLRLIIPVTHWNGEDPWVETTVTTQLIPSFFHAGKQDCLPSHPMCRQRPACRFYRPFRVVDRRHPIECNLKHLFVDRKR